LLKNKAFFITNLLGFSFPELCPACRRGMSGHEKLLCSDCRTNLPLTNFHLMEENPLKKMFWGRVPLEYAMSYYFFSKQTRVQQLIHHIKYRGLKELAVEVGRMMGRAIQENEKFCNAVEVIIPVPLHPKKLRKRGFNQSECLGRGISELIKKPLSTQNLIRQIHNPTQTKKSRFQRWKNVSGIFELLNAEELNGKHVLLVDDVVTTGSTIEACYLALKKANDVRISLASIGFAHDA